MKDDLQREVERIARLWRNLPAPARLGALMALIATAQQDGLIEGGTCDPESMSVSFRVRHPKEHGHDRAEEN